MKKTEKTCARCVMDTSALDIKFDEHGYCNYCTEFLRRADSILNETKEEKKSKLDRFIKLVRQKGRGKRYDCIIGVSGGVDSSWTLVNAIELGLRPLAVHMDSGWNSELANNNILNLVKNLNVDIYIYKIDFDEYRKLMHAFFDADVIDIELLYDNAMLALNYQQALRHEIKFILAGTNMATEGMSMPDSWYWYKFDRTNIIQIGKRFQGLKNLETYPSIGVIRYHWYKYLRRIHWVSFLDYLNYNKQQAIIRLENDFGFHQYPYKHYESIFTRLYQSYILPKKFGVDKRRIHLATLVASGQMERLDALHQLQSAPYISEEALENDIKYFLEKMGWSREQLDSYLTRPAKSHRDYPSERPLFQFISGISQKFSPGLKGLLQSTHW